jgi:hypothetical protein
METAATQEAICKCITGIGGYIRWRKELGPLARLLYLLGRREPVLNIEAFLLGERFAVVIDPGRRNTGNMFNASRYRIFVCSSVDDFIPQFEAFKKEKLAEADIK